jgi:hypothetical protein
VKRFISDKNAVFDIFYKHGRLLVHLLAENMIEIAGEN